MRRRFPFSDPDALLSGRLDPDDAPPELKEVAGLIRAARSPATAHELASEDHLTAAIAAEMRRSAPVGVDLESRRRRLIGQALSGKVIAATAAVLLSGGAAAAATGSLPAAVQRAVSHGLAYIGISVPAPAAHHSPVRSSSNTESNGHGTGSNGRGTGKSAIGADRYGLCTAYLHPGKTSATSTGTKSSATSFSRLAADAQAKGETIAQYCQGATPPSTTVGTNRGSTHRPTTRTTPARTRRPTDNSAGKPPTSAHRHPPKTTPTQPGRSSTTPAGKVPGRGSANSSAARNIAGAATHATTPPGKTCTGSSPKSTTTTSSATTTTLAATVPSPGSAGRNAGKGVPSAHSH